MALEYASPELANLIAARLTPEEFERRARAPLSEAEVEEVAELVAWFTRRYPTVAERLAYARRKFRQYAGVAEPSSTQAGDYEATAKRLADAHRASDPRTELVLLDPDPEGEIRLLEVTGSAPTLNQPIAVSLMPRPDLGVPFRSSIVLLSPEEWRRVQREELALPDGWIAARMCPI